jgi:GNAT superfamily N-acetyltransferase
MAGRPPPDPTELRRVAAGRHATGDGHFEVEQAAGGWMLTDMQATNELGLPLVRGPFKTLEEARAAMAAARSGPAPVSNLAERIAAIPQRPAGSARARRGGPASDAAGSGRAVEPPAPLPVVIREFRSRDAADLRALWESADFTSIGDDDMSLRRFAQRNPGLLLVAAQGPAVVGSAMGAWDGRRGWLYHVAVAVPHRRQGVATRLVRAVEAGLAALGCPRVNVIVGEANEAGLGFWKALGYEIRPNTQLGRNLGPVDPQA